MMFVEVLSPLGAVEVVPLAVYLALPIEVVAVSRARLMSRVDVVRARARVRRLP